MSYPRTASRLKCTNLYVALHKDETTTGRPAGQEKELEMFVTYILSKLRAYMRYRETIRELSQLSDRELDDLGFSRFQIDAIARQHSAA